MTQYNDAAILNVLKPIILDLDALLYELNITKPEYTVNVDVGGQGFGFGFKENEATNEALRDLMNSSMLEPLMLKGLELTKPYSGFYKIFDRSDFYEEHIK